MGEINQGMGSAHGGQ